MSPDEIWRAKAIELFPDLREYAIEGESIYTLLSELLTRCCEAHEAGNEEELRKIYGFAEWCFRREEEDLWNAAGVGFYEHLVDEEITRDQIPVWVKPDVFAELVPLLEWRAGPEGFARILGEYEKAHPEIRQQGSEA